MSEQQHSTADRLDHCPIRVPACLLAAALLAASAGAAASADGAATTGASTAVAPQPPPSSTPSTAPSSPDPAPAAPSAPPAATPASAPPVATPGPAVPPPSASGKGDKPGFLQEFGRWWTQSAADFAAKMKDAQKRFDDYNAQQKEAANKAAAATQKAMKEAATATTDAATAIVLLPSTRIIETRERCAAAGNGAPDCQATAIEACRGKGFGRGQPLDVRSEENCGTVMFLSKPAGAKPEGKCAVETILSRAICQ